MEFETCTPWPNVLPGLVEFNFPKYGWLNFDDVGHCCCFTEKCEILLDGCNDFENERQEPPIDWRLSLGNAWFWFCSRGVNWGFGAVPFKGVDIEYPKGEKMSY